MAEKLPLTEMPKSSWESEAAGVLLFAPFIDQLNLPQVVQEPARPYKNHSRPQLLSSFLALKLIGTERYAHLTEHAFDPGLAFSPVSTCCPSAQPCPPTPTAWTRFTCCLAAEFRQAGRPAQAL